MNYSTIVIKKILTRKNSRAVAILLSKLQLCLFFDI